MNHFLISTFSAKSGNGGQYLVCTGEKEQEKRKKILGEGKYLVSKGFEEWSCIVGKSLKIK